MVIVLAVGLSFSQRFKKRIDAEVPHKVGPPVRLTVSPQSAERLARLSSEPVFVRQSPDGTRVQIENRPLVPLVMLTDHEAVLGLREAIVAASSRFGRDLVGVALERRRRGGLDPAVELTRGGRSTGP